MEKWMKENVLGEGFCRDGILLKKEIRISGGERDREKNNKSGIMGFKHEDSWASCVCGRVSR